MAGQTMPAEAAVIIDCERLRLYSRLAHTFFCGTFNQRRSERKYIRRIYSDGCLPKIVRWQNYQKYPQNSFPKACGEKKPYHFSALYLQEILQHAGVIPC